MENKNNKIEKLLIVPAEKLVQPEEMFLKRFGSLLKHGFNQPLQYSGELQMYGDMPKVLGKENTFILGKYKSHFLSKGFPEQCQYPSCHGTPEGTTVTLKELDGVMKKIDAILLSVLAGEKIIESVIRKAKANNVPIAMIDFNDHEALYGMDDKGKKENMFRGFIPGEHFDLFFKKDLYLGYKTDRVLPLAPVPVRPESYNFNIVPKDRTIFFSGRLRPTWCQGDRVETTELVKKNFTDALIIEFEEKDKATSVKDYWNNIARSKMALSPSGRVWDSFRHCEVGLAPSACLIVPKPYVETVSPYLIDGENAIVFDTKLGEDGKHHLIDAQGLVKKINYYLDDPEECDRLAKNWKADVLEGHTVFARSKYIVESMEKVFYQK